MAHRSSTLFALVSLLLHAGTAGRAAPPTNDMIEVVVEEDQFRLHKPGELVEIVSDAVAENGKAARMPGSHFSWAVQLANPQRFAPRGEWSCFVRLRYETQGEGTGEAFWAGRYTDRARRNAEIHERIEPQGRSYREYSLGTTVLSQDCYLWVAPPRPVNPSIKAVYVDSFIFRRPRCRPPVAGWTNALKPKGTPGAELTLAENSQSSYHIVLPRQPSTVEEKAAEELSLWLYEMTGAAIPIVREGNADLDGHVISVGATEHAKRLGSDSATLGLDGYRIAVGGNALAIAGGSRRGVLNGVYALLEEDLGCRWYLPGRENAVIPRNPTLRFRPVPRTFLPPFELLRCVHYSDVVGDVNWNLRNRTFHWGPKVNAEWGGYAKWVPSFAHTYNRYLPPSRYFPKHPDYYALIGGKRVKQQFCPTHPAVVSTVIEKAKAWLAETPDAVFLDVSPNDGGGACHCPRCQALIDREGTEMAPLLRLVNKVADAIRPNHPHVHVTTLAYLNTVVPPKTFGPRPNVVPWLCTDAHAWSFSDLFVWETNRSSGAMTAWHTRWQAPFLVWDYPSQFRGGVVNFNLPTIGPNLRWYVKHGAEGILFQTAHNENRGIDHSYQRCWVFAKLGWDPDLDTRALVRDFNWGFYGVAAPHVLAYDDMLWSAWEAWHEENVTGTRWDVTVARQEKRPGRAWTTIKEDDAFWREAARHFDAAEKSVTEDPVLRQRVRTARLPLVLRTLEQGPQGDVEAYKALIEEFEADARKAKLFIIDGIVGPPIKEDLSRKIAYWRKLAAPPPSELPLVELNNAWRFAPDPDDKGLAEKWFEPNYSDLAWTTVRSDTGHGWESQGFKGEHLGWYRQTFSVTRDMLKRPALWMMFGAVDEQARILINGKLAFLHTVKSTGLPVETLWNRPFLFDAKPFVKSGDNVLAVRVEDTIGMAGIWRPVRFVLQDTKPNPQQILDTLKLIEDRRRLGLE
jgi:hypothetical protein